MEQYPQEVQKECILRGRGSETDLEQGFSRVLSLTGVMLMDLAGRAVFMVSNGLAPDPGLAGLLDRLFLENPGGPVPMLVASLGSVVCRGLRLRLLRRPATAGCRDESSALRRGFPIPAASPVLEMCAAGGPGLRWPRNCSAPTLDVKRRARESGYP